jgi:hypothetical protein
MCYSFYKKGEVTGDWRRLHNEKLYDLCCSPDIICLIKARRMIWVGHVASRKTEGVHISFLWALLERKRTLARGRRGLKNNIKKDLQKLGMGAWAGLI